MTPILIVGGYGVFGSRVAERLARHPDLELLVAGRDNAKARAAAQTLTRRFPRGAEVAPAVFDAARAGRADIARLGARIVINASGPFQAQSYALAEAAIAAGCHYIDLADARAFVTGIKRLDSAARAANVLAVSGASTVPGLSSAVVAAHAPAFDRLDSLEIGISPGNRFDPGEATTASVLSYAGKPFSIRVYGREDTVHGWQGLTRHTFPEIGRRWMSDAEVPDLDLFPAHYPSLETVRFRAGLEVGVFHLGIWGLSLLVRAGLIRDAGRLTGPLLAAKRCLGFLGSDRGGMYVTLDGQSRGGAKRRVTWHLVASSGHGPYVPASASVILARRLAAGTETRRGAMPCMGLITLDDFRAEVEDLDITCAAAEC